MANRFRDLSDEVNRRLDALPNGEGERIREASRAQLDAEHAAWRRRARLYRVTATIGRADAAPPAVERLLDELLFTCAGMGPVVTETIGDPRLCVTVAVEGDGIVDAVGQAVVSISDGFARAEPNAVAAVHAVEAALA